MAKCIGVLLLALAALALDGAAGTHDQQVVCYLASWSVYRPGAGKFNIEDIDPTLCTTLIYAFAGLDEITFAMKPIDPRYDVKGRAIERTVGLKAQNPLLKVVAAVGGWTEGSTKYSAMARNSTARRAFIDSAVGFIQQYNLDGLDLDWEYPATRGGVPADRENFVLLVKELKEEFSKYGWSLTAAVAADQGIIGVAYNIPELSQYLDFMHIASYDYHGKWDGRTGHNAPLYPRDDESAADKMRNVEYTVKMYLDAGAPPEKVVLGLGFFGRSYLLQDPASNSIGAPSLPTAFAGPYTKEDGFLGYNEICEKQTLEQGQWTLVWQKSHQVPYMYQNNMWISFDDAMSIGLKVAFAQKLGLGGIMVWSVDTDDFNGTCSQTGMKYPLLNAVKKALSSHTAMRPASSINDSISEHQLEQEPQAVPIDSTVSELEQEAHVVPDNTSIIETELEGEPQGISVNSSIPEIILEQEPHDVADNTSVSVPQFEEPLSATDNTNVSEPLFEEPHSAPDNASLSEQTFEDLQAVLVNDSVSDVKPEESQSVPLEGIVSEIKPEEPQDVSVDGSVLEVKPEEEPHNVSVDGIVPEMKTDEAHAVLVDGSVPEVKAEEETHNVSADGVVFEIKPEEPHSVPVDGSVHEIKPEEPHGVEVDGSVHGITPSEPHGVQVDGSVHEIIPEEPHNAQADGSVHGITSQEPLGVQVDGSVHEIIPEEPHNAQADGSVHGITSQEPLGVQVDGNIHGITHDEPHGVQVDGSVHGITPEEPQIVPINSSIPEMKPEEELQGFGFEVRPEEPHGTPANPKFLSPEGRSIAFEVIDTESILNGTEEDLTSVMQTSVMPEMGEQSTVESMPEMETDSSTMFMPEVDEHSSTTAMPDMPEHSTMTSMPDMFDTEENNTMVSTPEMEEKMTSTSISTDLDDLHNISPTPDINDLQSISIVPDLHDRKHMPSTTEKDVMHSFTTQKEIEIHSVTKPTFELGDKSVDTNTLGDVKQANKGRTNYRGARGGSGVCIPAASALLVLLAAAMALC
ncbi:oviduct-specific glycoprotein-like [Penaeus indicus]|uniref:oviduct-specific glycoprotein-like n=1 Tax=Penaeus indicus TaxID=29960 RepID=UPI00300C6953